MTNFCWAKQFFNKPHKKSSLEVSVNSCAKFCVLSNDQSLLSIKKCFFFLLKNYTRYLQLSIQQHIYGGGKFKIRCSYIEITTLLTCCSVARFNWNKFANFIKHNILLVIPFKSLVFLKLKFIPDSSVRNLPHPY